MRRGQLPFMSHPDVFSRLEFMGIAGEDLYRRAVSFSYLGLSALISWITYLANIENAIEVRV